jgi:hypothetical protein
MLHELEGLDVEQVSDVLLVARQEIIDAEDRPSFSEKALTEMTP